MTEQERFRRLFRGERVDRPPLLEEGVRDHVLERWREDGLPRGKTHLEVFGLTPHENIGPDLKYVSSYFGRILGLSASDYRRAFDVSPRRFPADWAQTVARLEQRDHIVCVWASRGFFQALGVGDWPTFEQVLCGTIERPDRIRDRVALYGDFCAQLLDMVLREVDPEFIYLSEPISDNDGPLISPSMFEEFMIPAYERIIATAHEHGCHNILVSTYGNSARLFPSMVAAGVTMLWISEATEAPELDYSALRDRFGPELGLIGGVPLSVLREGTEATIRSRLQEILPPLLRSGRYIPLAGGRIRDDIPWDSYRLYRETMADVIRSVSCSSQSSSPHA
ncbi:MAG: uroporphyrinogen decarboxylase family protein [Gemmatimonadales bacterium]|jgi:hypothetical protein